MNQNGYEELLFDRDFYKNKWFRMKAEQEKDEPGVHVDLKVYQGRDTCLYQVNGLLMPVIEKEDDVLDDDSSGAVIVANKLWGIGQVYYKGDVVNFGPFNYMVIKNSPPYDGEGYSVGPEGHPDYFVKITSARFTKDDLIEGRLQIVEPGDQYIENSDIYIYLKPPGQTENQVLPPPGGAWYQYTRK